MEAYLWNLQLGKKKKKVVKNVFHMLEGKNNLM